MKRSAQAALLVLLIGVLVFLAGLTWYLGTILPGFLLAFVLVVAGGFLAEWAREWYVDRRRAALGLGPRYHGIPQRERPGRPR